MQYIALLKGTRDLQKIRAEGQNVPLTSKAEILEVLFNDEDIDLIIGNSFINQEIGEEMFLRLYNLCIHLHSSSKKRVTGFSKKSSVEVGNTDFLIHLIDRPLDFTALVARDKGVRIVLKNALKLFGESESRSLENEQKMNTLINATMESNSVVESLRLVNKDFVRDLEKAYSIIDTLFSNINYIKGVPIKQKQLRVCSSEQFGNYSSIVYMKCYEQNCNSVPLAEAVKDLLLRHENLSTRILVLESVDGTRAYNKLPVAYKSFVELTEKDFVNSDIKMLGVQASIIEGVMKNPHSRFDCIIIVDNILNEDCIFENIELLKMDRFLVESVLTERRNDWVSVETGYNRVSKEEYMLSKITSQIVNKIMER